MAVSRRARSAGALTRKSWFVPSAGETVTAGDMSASTDCWMYDMQCVLKVRASNVTSSRCKLPRRRWRGLARVVHAFASAVAQVTPVETAAHIDGGTTYAGGCRSTHRRCWGEPRPV